MAAGAVVDSLGKALQDDKKSEEEQVLQFKEFVWDQFLKYISSAILALTILNLSVEFLRGGGVLCFPPLNTKDVIAAEPDELDKEFSVRQIDFFNGYCSRSIPATEFFPLYILVHGILLIAPHYIWSAVFKGDFDSFFAVTRKLDRLRDRNTGEYDPTNFDRVEKLEIEFGGRRRKIFIFYIAKLILQFCVCIGSYIFSAAFFINFTSVFDCPRDLAENNVISERWPLNVTIPCVYTSLRILALVRYADYILLGLAVCLIILGLAWCFIRHTKELGHIDIANFVFQSCLSTKTYVFPPFYEIRRRINHSDNCWFCCYPFALFKQSCRGCIACNFDFKIFSPHIKNDLDFFELYLFRADTSHGRVFKEIQIDKVLRKLHGEDHQLLHLFLDAQHDMRAQIRDKAIAETRRQEAERERQTSQGESGPSRGATAAQNDDGASPARSGGTSTAESSPISPDLDRVKDLASFFKMGPGGFSRNPETFAFLQLKQHLSNIKWRPVEGIRDRLYGFVLYSPKHLEGDQKGQPKTDMALDISFGSSGYALVLARAFKKVVSVNFHPFFRNEKEPVNKKAYYTNYYEVNLPVDIFTQVNTNITTATDKIFEHMRKPVKKPADFIVVGPLTEDSQNVTVTLTIETLHTVGLIEEKAILLAVRPLKIGHRIMTQRFCKYVPSEALFDGSIHTETVVKDLRSELGDEAEVPVEGFSGIRVECGDTECIFEFVTYKYNGEKRKEVVHKPPPSNEVPTPAPSIIERSQSMPPLPGGSHLAELGQFLQNLGGALGQLGPRPAMPILARSNTFPVRDGSSSVLSPPLGIVPNNDITARLTQNQPNQPDSAQQHPDNRRGSDGRGQHTLIPRGRGRALIRELAVSHTHHDPGSRGSVSDQGEMGRFRRDSSNTSGFLSPTQFDSVSEEEEGNLPQVSSHS